MRRAVRAFACELLRARSQRPAACVLLPACGAAWRASSSDAAAFAVLTGALREHAAPLSVEAAGVQPLSSPAEWREKLHELIGKAQDRILLSSLYWGCDSREELRLREALRARLAAAPRLRCTVLLDGRRATRPAAGSSCAAELAAALPTASVRLLSPPSIASLALPPRLREANGVMHAKVAVFDDVSLWGGANLAETYLTKRQDRCVSVRSRALADAAERALEALLAGAHAVDAPPQPARRVREAAREMASRLRASAANGGAAEGDTLAFLCSQAGWAGVRGEEAVTGALAASAGALALSTPYLNLPVRLERQLSSTAAPLTLLSASPACHAWAGASGSAALVAPAYAVLAHRSLRRLTAARARRGLPPPALLEWRRVGEEYHAKGMWSWPGPEGGEPFATLVGSTNYGVRSARADLELSLALVTLDDGLRARLGGEWRALAASASAASPEELAARMPGMSVRVAAHLARLWL